MGSDDCSCGQKPVTVVLVGCTQHGKSSIIRSLLDYAGRNVDGDAVKTGSYGNASTTKECHSFPIVIKILNHKLVDMDGNVLIVNSAEDVDEVESMGDVNFDSDEDEDGGNDDPACKHISTESGRHIHLRIIDTPGLDDTENPTSTDAETDFGVDVPMRVEDEKHKMAILRAITAEGAINSVCFVISTEHQLGQTVPELLREYKNLFNSSGLGDNYHFVHTKVNPGDMWDKMKSRPGPVNRVMSTWTATHHFINNLPVDPLSEYLSQRAIANLLTALAEDNVQTVNWLRYPKTGAHRFIESHLRGALEIDEAYYKKRAKDFATRLDEAETTKKGLEARVARERDSWSSLVTAIKDLDTCDLVSLKPAMTLYHPDEWFVRSRLTFDISTDFPVRDIKKESKWPSLSSWQGSSDIYWTGKCRWCQDLVANKRNDSIQGTVELFGWKKEIEAGRIKRLTTEKDEAWEEYQNTTKELAKTQAEILEATEGKTSSEAEIAKTASQKAILRQDHIACDVIRDKGQYLATTSLISYAFGLGITRNKLYRFQLPKPIGTDSVYQAKVKYRAKREAFSSMLKTCETMVQSLRERGQMIAEIGRALDETQATMQRSTVAAKRKAQGLDEWSSVVSDTAKGVDQVVVDRALRILSDEFTPVLERGRETLVETISQHVFALKEKIAFTKEAAKKVSEIQEKHKRDVERWQAKMLDIKASEMAAKAMLDVAIDRDKSISGRFAALKRGIDAHGPGSEKIWDGLFRELKECYNNNPKHWNLFLEEI
ncbi:hypothetical protein B0H66DRAFT_597542 [Apodospora peruviana]|uniref:G domain-containing protein n=1 Tax=Apodospora peruviana TaxID=516989 RepID=A0AAE0MEZ0_9PEZI|nr:hypothetical protein B0H66DRAFT_597542 [Apodospora peruviana]